ncbi:MAG: hypothetical protein ACREYF_18690 [Gammaproteobacteria bacterium]
MSKLSKKAMKKLEQLAEIRNQSLEDTKNFVLETSLQQAGTGKEQLLRGSRYMLRRVIPFAATVLRSLALRRLASHASSDNELASRRGYRGINFRIPNIFSISNSKRSAPMKDRIDRRIRPETYVMGVDVLNRYFCRGTTDRWLPARFAALRSRFVPA